jgi:hypothetical protein
MKHLIAIAVAAPLMLTGCQTTGSAPPATIVDFLPAEVQAQAVKVCGFAGNLKDIASVIAAFGGPALPGVVGFAINALCEGRPALRSRARSTAAMAGWSWRALSQHAERAHAGQGGTLMARPSSRHRLGNARFGGWKPDRPKTGKDWHLDKALGAPRAVLPDNPSCDPAFFPGMKDQKTLGACTGESLALALEYCVIKKAAGKGEDVTSKWWKRWSLSGLAAYYWARELEKTVDQDDGAEIRDAIDGARRNGIPTEAAWPYVVSKFKARPDAAAMKTAAWHKPHELKTYRCDGAGGSREETLTNMLRALEAGMPVNFGFACPERWGDYDRTGRIPLP